MDRRAALRRAALVVGGAVYTSTIAGVLAGCEARRTPDGAWTPRALTVDQLDLVATIAEHILPETDSPGARAVGVHRFIDAMLADSSPDEERRRFLADRKSTRLNSSHSQISYAVFCLKKKKTSSTCTTKASPKAAPRVSAHSSMN